MRPQPLRGHGVTLGVRLAPVLRLPPRRARGKADRGVRHRLRVDAARDGGGLGVEHGGQARLHRPGLGVGCGLGVAGLGLARLVPAARSLRFARRQTQPRVSEVGVNLGRSLQRHHQARRQGLRRALGRGSEALVSSAIFLSICYFIIINIFFILLVRIIFILESFL